MAAEELRKYDHATGSVSLEQTLECDHATGSVSLGQTLECDHATGSVSLEQTLKCDHATGSVSLGPTLKFQKTRTLSISPSLSPACRLRREVPPVCPCILADQLPLFACMMEMDASP